MTHHVSKVSALATAALLTCMLIHLDVRNVGSFNYDAPDLSILAQNAQCFGG